MDIPKSWLLNRFIQLLHLKILLWIKKLANTTLKHKHKHKSQILTQTLILRLVGEVELIQVLFSQIQLKENQFHIIIQVSMMKIINTNLRNGTSDEFLNDIVITYFDNDIFETELGPTRSFSPFCA